MTGAIDAILLIAFGGPRAPEEIRPFLASVARGREISPERLAEVARHYERMPGGRSPLNEWTLTQARALESALATADTPLPVRIGMRNWHPYLRSTLAEMAAASVQRALGIILSPLRTEASWERYMKDVDGARGLVPGAPDVVFAPPWGAHPRFLTAVAERLRHALDALPAAARAGAPVVFTAHSVPTAMAAASPYVADFTAAAGAVADRVGLARWSLAYQSRGGHPDEPWLDPDVNVVLRELGRAGERHVVVVPLGFVCDHVEVLYDLDVEARLTARAAGVEFHRAAAVNDHPEFIAALADIVRGQILTPEASPPSSTPPRRDTPAQSFGASTTQRPGTRVAERQAGPGGGNAGAGGRDADSRPRR